jgi:acylphosphatase
MSMEDNGKVAYALKIHGMVQGVGFRYSAVRAARSAGVNGWVRNERDGTVGIFCEGDKEAVDRFVSWCKKGPPAANVRNVDVEEKTYRGRYRDFSVAF